VFLCTVVHVTIFDHIWSPDCTVYMCFTLQTTHTVSIDPHQLCGMTFRLDWVTVTVVEHSARLAHHHHHHILFAKAQALPRTVFTRCCINSHFDLLIDWLIWLTDWLIDWMIDWKRLITANDSCGVLSTDCRARQQAARVGPVSAGC